MTSLSSLSIPARERLIVALDVPDIARALALVDELGDAVTFYKVGLQLCMSGEYFTLIRRLREAGKKIFADLKFFDVPQTVASAVEGLARHAPDFATVHGNDAILQAAAAHKGKMKILAVTALTSLDKGDLTDLGFECSAEALVISRARRALALGCDGVVSSGLEAPALRKHVDHKLLVVCPGVRPIDNCMDDQKRTVDVKQAFENGADYIVVGRPILRYEGYVSPREAALDIQLKIEDIFR